MVVNTDHIQTGQTHCALIHRERIGVCHAELIRLQTGGNIRMRFRIHIGIHAQGHRCAFTHTQGDFVDALQFGRGFRVETKNALLQRKRDFTFRLCHTREHHTIGRRTRRQSTRDFTLGHRVKKCSALGKQTQNAQIRARLDRIAHMNVTFIRRVLPRRPICQQLRLRINVQRRAKTFGQIIQRGIF